MQTRARQVSFGNHASPMTAGYDAISIPAARKLEFNIKITVSTTPETAG